MHTYITKKLTIITLLFVATIFGQFGMIEWSTSASKQYMNAVSTLSSIKSLEQLEEGIAALGATKIISGPEAVWRLPFPSRGHKVIILSEKDKVIAVDMTDADGSIDYKNVSKWKIPSFSSKVLIAIFLNFPYTLALMLILMNEENGTSIIFAFLFILGGTALVYVFWLKLGIL